MATPNATQPIMWAGGFICPFHGDNLVGLTFRKPGLLECADCGTTFTQRKTSLGFDHEKRKEGEPVR